MTFTALHRAVGAPPGPLTGEILNQAIEEGVEESAELDWKRQLPELSSLKKSDIDKDIAAMANSGGGIIVYGVLEEDKRATSRHDAGILDERYQRSLRQIAFSSITPPVLDLRVHDISTEGPQAYAIEVAASNDGPHLIFNNQYFGAPFRNDADTMWMNERQLEASYRARFDEHRFATAAIDKLYEDAAYGRDMERAWLIAVARPRVLPHHMESHIGKVHALLDDAERRTLVLSTRDAVHPLVTVQHGDIRRGLRRWVIGQRGGASSAWRDAWFEIHDNGAVTLAAAVGAHRVSQGYVLEGDEIGVDAVEAAVSDFLAVVRETASREGIGEYDLRIGIELGSGEDMVFGEASPIWGRDFSRARPIRRFVPVEVTINALRSEHDFHSDVFAIVRDCVNQGGVTDPTAMKAPPSEPVNPESQSG